jgi:hypothetical protein
VSEVILEYSPRSNDVRADTTGTLLDGNHLRESVDGSLGSRDVSLVRGALVVKGSRDVQVRALGLADVGEGSLDSVVCAELGSVGHTTFLPTASISITVRNAFSDSPEMGTRKLPAAPVCQSSQNYAPYRR